MLSSSPNPSMAPRSASPDDLVVSALDRAGIVGQRLRERLAKDLKAKVLFRRGGDAIEVIGLPGTGKHKVVSAAHEVANAAFGRAGGISVFRCDEPTDGRLESAVHRAIEGARGGTLVFERFGELEASRRAEVTRAMRERGGDALLLAVSDKELDGSALDSRPATSIRLKPLHERDEDIWELVDHFYTGLSEDQVLGECEGFSRQAKADLSEAIRETSLVSVRRLRDIVRDVVFEALAEGELPMNSPATTSAPTSSVPSVRPRKAAAATMLRSSRASSRRPSSPTRRRRLSWPSSPNSTVSRRTSCAVRSRSCARSSRVSKGSPEATATS